MHRQPELVVSTLDFARLSRLLEGLPRDRAEAHAELEAELARATLVAPEAMPPDVVTMNSTVRFRIEPNGAEFARTLVYPHEEDGCENAISILAPAGSALLGLTVGDVITWPKPTGGNLQVRVEDVLYQPERAGVLHR